ncbi:MAG: hypothetical protein KPEEDBHJ_01618 [Anaerolineales bacterium]|nr:hypothetical protein [Anaerolineales bacterium]
MERGIKQLKSMEISQLLGVLIIFVGAVFRLRQYLVNRSFWVDEASLALNIVNRNYIELTRPLDYDQGAPIGFLFIAKLIFQIFGNHDFVLRIIPLLSGIGALWVFNKIVKEEQEAFGFFTLFLLSFSGAMIWYSSEFKQYSSDVLVAVGLLWFTLQCVRDDARASDFLRLGAVGAFSIWLSHPSAFVLAASGLVLALDTIINNRRGRIPWLIAVGVSWLIMFFATYMVSLRHLIGSDNLQEYWEYSYAPLPPWEHLEWYKMVLQSTLPPLTPSILTIVFNSLSEIFLYLFGLGLILLGAASLFWRRWQSGVLVILPIGLMFVASSLHRYPISERFIYFWLPSSMMLLTEGMRWLYLTIAKASRIGAGLLWGCIAILLCWTSVTQAYNNFISPPLGEDIKPVLAYLERNVQPGDIVYIHNGSVTPFLYYESQYPLRAGEVFLAKKSWNFKRFIIDVENFQGSERIWFVFSHVVSCDCDGGLSERIQAHVDLLDEYGVMLDRYDASRAVVYLYDLSK